MTFSKKPSGGFPSYPCLQILYLGARVLPVFLAMLSPTEAQAPNIPSAETSSKVTGLDLDRREFSRSDMIDVLAQAEESYGTHAISADLASHLEGNTISVFDTPIGMLWLYFEPGGRAVWASNVGYLETGAWREMDDQDGTGLICVTFGGREYCNLLFRSSGEFDREMFLVRQRDQQGQLFSYWVATLHEGISDAVQAAMTQDDNRNKAESAGVNTEAFEALVSAYADYARVSVCAKYGLAFTPQNVKALESAAKLLQTDIPEIQQNAAWEEGAKAGARMENNVFRNPSEAEGQCRALRNRVQIVLDRSSVKRKPF